MFCNLFYVQSNLGVKMTHGRKPLQSERRVLRKRKDDLTRTLTGGFYAEPKDRLCRPDRRLSTEEDKLCGYTQGFPQRRRINSADIRKAFLWTWDDTVVHSGKRNIRLRLLRCQLAKEKSMAKQRERKYRGIVIGLILGLLMTGVMSFTVFAEEAESPPNTAPAVENTEDVLAGEDVVVGSGTDAESSSEDAGAESDDGKSDDAQITEGGSASEATAVQESEASEAASEAQTDSEAADDKEEAASVTKTSEESGSQTETEAPADADAAKSGTDASDPSAEKAASEGTAASAAGASSDSAAAVEEPAPGRALLAGAPGTSGEPTSPTQNGEMADLTDNQAAQTADESLKGTAATSQADVENAIQKAIDAALASASSTATTLRVDVESGDYAGGLKIAKPDGSTLNSKLILYVFAPGSYSGADTGAITTGKISAAADGSTKVSGDILIDGINVVLAGLYYSLDTKITVRNAKADIYGTTESDTINTILDGSGTLVVHSGDGADDITVSGSTTTGGVVATVYGEKGDDKFTVDLISGTKNASGTAPKQAEVRISDTDNGTLELTGALQEGNSNALSGTITMTSTSKRARVTAVNSEGYKTYINANGTTDYMDSLLNKKEVVLNPGDSVKAASFTDYVLTGTNVDGVTVDGANAYFSNIKAVSDGTLTVGSIEAPLVNVLLQGTEIILNGAINAKNLTVRAAGRVHPSREDMSIELAGIDTISVSGNVDAQTARVQVLKDAELKANNIELTADTAANIDRDALIGSFGDKIFSFADLISTIQINGRLEACAGSIKAIARAVITLLTAGDARASFDSMTALPEAVVEIGGNANLIATGDVLARAVSRVIGAAKAYAGENPNASCAVTVIGAKTNTLVEGKILAGGNVTVAADGSAKAETNASGADAGLAVTAADEDVSALVRGDNTIEALGKVDVHSTMTGDYHTVGSAGGQDQGYETTLANTQVTLKNISKALQSLAGASAGKIGLLEELFARMTQNAYNQNAGIVATFEKAAYAMKDGAVRALDVKNAYGATAVSYVNGKNLAGINTFGYIYAGEGLNVKADADFAAVTRADSFESAADEANPSAAAMANTIFENVADIRFGTIYAKDLTVSAVSGKETRPVTSIVKAYAGDGTYDGIAGATALQKALAKTNALIGTGAAINLLNRTSLFVKALQYDRFVTVADAAAAGNGTTDGSGAGFAFSVTGADVRSAVEDGVVIKTFSPKMGAQALKRDEISDFVAELTLLAPMVDQVAVTADRQGDEVIYASAGTDGGDGNAIRAAAALFSGSSVEAYLGDPGSDEVLDAAGNVDVTANNRGARQAAADANAVPAAGSGMTLTMTYTNDTSSADLQRALKSNDLTVRAVSNVKTRSRAKAGAKGTKTVKEPGDDGDDGDADQRASLILGGAASIAADGNNGISDSILIELSKEKAKAKTAEGSMDAAAAYALNVEKNSAKAHVTGKYEIIASGDFRLEGLGENGADILADASAVKKESAEGTDTGIGTAAAVSVVDYSFEAILDSGKTAATSVTVHAGIPNADAASYKVTAISGAGDSGIGLVGSIAINEVHGTSDAAIAQGTAQISAARDMVIKAEDLHTEETVATAGVSEDGSAVRAAGEGNPAQIGVGAAFALSDVRTRTSAAVEAGRVVEGLRVYILANNKDVRGTYSAAGTDPYGQEFAAGAADASAAVSIGENESTAIADDDSQLIASGESDGSEIARDGEPKTGDIYIRGVFNSNVKTLATVFEAEEHTYAGGTAAVNLAASNAIAEMRGFATANGNVLILADSDDVDETTAKTGKEPSDLRRYLARMGLAETMENALAVIRGDLSGSGTNMKNEIAALINAALNRCKDAKGTDASNSNPLTYNVLASQNAKTEGTDEPNIRKAQEESNGLAASGTNVDVGEGIVRDDLPGEKIRAAAAVGLNVTAHNAHASVIGTIDKTNRNVDIRAEVTGSANVKAFTERMAADKNGYQNAYGAAISVNRNDARAEIAKGTTPSRVESRGEISLTAEQNRNLSYDDRSRFEAEAGSGDYGYYEEQEFGTIVIVRSESATEALVADDTLINANLDKNRGVVTVEAIEGGRIAARTYGTTHGSSFIIVDAKDRIRTDIGAKANITGHYIVVRAAKEEAGSIPEIYTLSDGKNYIGYSAVGDGEEKVYQVHADTSEVSDLVRQYGESNALWGADYFLETMYKDQFGTFDMQAMGTSMILREALLVSASIGKEAVLTSVGNINITANTSSKAAALLGTDDFNREPWPMLGTSIVLMTSDNETKTVVGDDARLTASGYYAQIAMEDAVKAAAVHPGVSEQALLNVLGGGSIVVLTDSDNVLSEVGTGVVIEGASGAAVESAIDNDKYSLVSPSSDEAGGKATGGNNSYIYSGSSVLTKAGINTKIRSSKGDVSLKARTVEQLIGMPGANADALPGAIAAVMNIMRTESTTVVETEKVEITAKGDVHIEAKAAGSLIAIEPVSKEVRYSPKGMVVFFDAARCVETLLGEGSTVTAGGNVYMTSSLDEKMLIVTLCTEGTEGDGLTGLAAGAKSRNIVRTVAGAKEGQDIRAEETEDAGASTSVTANGSIAVTAVLDSQNQVVTSGADEKPGAARGGAAAAIIEKNVIDAIINNLAYLKAMASMPAITVEKAGRDMNGKKKTDSRTGIILYAGAKEDIIMSVEGRSASGGISVNGTIADVNVANTVRARAGKEAQLYAGTEIKDEFTGEVGDTSASGDVHIEAEDNTWALILAGGLSRADAAANSSTVFYGFFGKTVSAGNEGLVAAAKDSVEVIANESTTVDSFLTASWQSSEAAGVSGAVYFKNKADAYASGYLRGGKAVAVTSESVDKFNSVEAVRDFKEYYGSAGSALLVYLYNGASSEIGDGSVVQGGDVIVAADTNEIVNAYVQGTSFTDWLVLKGGSLLVVLTGTETIARIGADASIGGAYSEKAGDVTVRAKNTYKLTGVVGLDIKGEQTKGGVSAAASVSYNTVDASVGRGTQMKVQSLSVKADSVRTVDLLTTILGESNPVETASTAAVVAIGSMLNEDAHDAIYVAGQSILPGNAMNFILYHGGTRVRFNDFAEGSLPTIDIDGILAAGLPGAGSTMGMAGGLQEYASLLQTDGDAAAEPDAAGMIEGKVTRTKAAYNGQEDSVSARIEPNVVVEADGDITVNAKDLVNLYVIAGAVGDSAQESVGSGTAAVFMNGNVYADTYGTLKSGGKISILASSESGTDARQDLTFRGTSVLKSLSHVAAQKGISAKQEPNRTGIYAIAIAGAQGASGGRENVAYVSVSPIVAARLHGTVKDADSLSIKAVFGYDHVHTVSIAAAKGNEELAGILALEYYDGTVEAGITNEAAVNISGNTLEVKTDSKAAMAPRAGIPGSEMGDTTVVTAAAAVNRTEAHAYIAGGINVKADAADVTVQADMKSEADVALLAETVDKAVLEMGVVILINDPVNLAYIGKNRVKELSHAKAQSGSGSLIAKNVYVNAELKAKSSVEGYLLSRGSSEYLNGLVVLGIANARNNASVGETNVNAESLTIKAHSANDMTVTGDAGGDLPYGIGGTAALGYIGTENVAELFATDAVINVGELSVLAGTDKERVTADVIVTVNPGGLTGAQMKAMNIAAARNELFNLARIEGGMNSSRMGVIVAREDVKVYSALDSLAKAEINVRKTDRGKGAIGAGAAFARQGGDAASNVTYTKVTAGNIYVQSWYNSEEGADLAMYLREDKGAIAIVVPAEDPDDILVKHMTSAKAAFTGAAVAELYGCDAEIANTVSVKVHAQSYAKALMNAPKMEYVYRYLGMNLIHADAAGVFKAEVVRPLENGDLSAKYVDINVSYIAMSDAMTSMIGDHRVGGLDANMAVAQTETFAEASLKRWIEHDPQVFIIADGKVGAHAYAAQTVGSYEGPDRGIPFSYGGANTTAEITVEQRAHFDPEVIRAAAQLKNLMIRSMLIGYSYFRDEADTEKISGACAELGYPVFEYGIDVAGRLPLYINKADSVVNVVNLAYIYGPGQIYVDLDVTILAETAVNSLGGVRLSPKSVDIAVQEGTEVSALVRNRTVASIGSYLILVVKQGQDIGISVASTDSSTAKAESLYASYVLDERDIGKVVKAGIGTLNEDLAQTCVDGDPSVMSVTRTVVGKHTYLEGPHINLVSVNNNWAEAGMKVVDGYFASGRYVNTVETVNAAYCKIDVGEETTMLAKGGNINLHLHSYLDSKAAATPEGTQFRDKESFTVRNYTRQSERVEIGERAYLEARFDISIVIRGTVSMEAYISDGNKLSSPDSLVHTANALHRYMYIDLRKQARLRTYYGDITLHIISAGDEVGGAETGDHMKAYASQSMIRGEAIKDLTARNNVNTVAKINTWENSEIYAPFGTINLKVQDGYGDNTPYNEKRRIDIQAKVRGRTSEQDDHNIVDAINYYTADLAVNVKHSTITGNNVNLTANRAATDILAESLVEEFLGLMFTQRVGAHNYLYFYADVNIWDGSYVRGYSNVSMDVRNESSELPDRNRGASKIQAISSVDGVLFMAMSNTNAVNTGKMREKISIRDSSYIYGRTISMKAYSWFVGDVTDNHGGRGLERSDFSNTIERDENSVTIDDGSILFVGAMAGAVLDITFNGNDLEVRQIGLAATPTVGNYYHALLISDDLIPDQEQGYLGVNVIRRRTTSSLIDNQLQKEASKIRERTVSGGMLTDTTILNRTGKSIEHDRCGIDLTKKATYADYDFYCQPTEGGRTYLFGVVTNGAADNYPAGGLISEVYYPSPIMGPTLTTVSAKGPVSYAIDDFPGLRSTVQAYRDRDGRMTTTVTEYDTAGNRNSGEYSGYGPGIADAGSVYSFDNSRPDWLVDRLEQEYGARSTSDERDQTDGLPVAQIVDNTAGSSDAANAAERPDEAVASNISDKNAVASNRADGSTAESAGTNAQSGAAGNQAAGSAANGSVNDDIKGSGADVDPDDGSDEKPALAMGGKALPVAAAAAAGALFIIFLLLKRRKEDEEQEQ